MNFPILDEIVQRLRQQLPEIGELLEWGFNGEPLTLPRPQYMPGVTDVGLLMRHAAQEVAFLKRLSYVAGGLPVVVRAKYSIKANLSADDARAILAEFSEVPAAFAFLLKQSGDDDIIDDATATIVDRLLLTDEQFQQVFELQQALAKHTSSKKP